MSRSERIATSSRRASRGIRSSKRLNIDLAKNPFGCKGFARKFDAKSFTRIPGNSSETAVIESGDPPKQPWHVL